MRVSGEQGRAAACCPHQAPLRIFHREFTSLDTTGKLQEWRSNLSLLASVGSLFFSRFPFPSALLLARICGHIGIYMCRTHTRPRKEGNTSTFFRIDKRDLFFHFKSPISPNCVIGIRNRSAGYRLRILDIRTIMRTDISNLRFFAK